MNPKSHNIWNRKAIGALALGVLLSGAPLLAQQDPQSQPAPNDQSAAPAQQQDQQGPPAPPPQDQQAQPAPPPQQDQQMPPQQPDQQAGPQDQALLHRNRRLRRILPQNGPSCRKPSRFQRER